MQSLGVMADNFGSTPRLSPPDTPARFATLYRASRYVQPQLRRERKLTWPLN